MAPRLRAAALLAALAGTTIFATPAAAASRLPVPAWETAPVIDFSRYDRASDVSGWHCRWRCGWHRGWGGWGRHRGWRRNRIDGGDVLIGAAIIGGAIAIANANNRRERDRDVVIVERDRDFRDTDADWDRRDDRRAPRRGSGASGLDNAVNMCLDRIERDVRVDTIDDVERTASGWQVSGALFNGSPFQCRIGNDGRIDRIDYGSGFGGVGYDDGAGGQWSEQRYVEARARVGGDVRPDLAVIEARMPPTGATSGRAAVRPAPGSAMPAYPGGPIPGEVIPETIDGDIGG